MTYLESLMIKCVFCTEDKLSMREYLCSWNSTATWQNLSSLDPNLSCLPLRTSPCPLMDIKPPPPPPPPLSVSNPTSITSPRHHSFILVTALLSAPLHCRNTDSGLHNLQSPQNSCHLLSLTCYNAIPPPVISAQLTPTTSPPPQEPSTKPWGTRPKLLLPQPSGTLDLNTSKTQIHFSLSNPSSNPIFSNFP